MIQNIITRISRIMAVPMAVTALVACNNETDTIEIPMDAVSISSVQITGGTVESRAEGSAYTGNLTLFYGSLDGTQSARYGYNDGWVCTSPAPLYWEDLTPTDGQYTFYAVAPLADYGVVKADQSLQEYYTASDLLMATAVTSQADTELSFTLNHVLSQVEVNLTNGGGMTDDELNTAALTIGGLQTAYTVTGTAATASGNAATDLKPLKNNANFRFIAPAQTVAADGLTLAFTVTINGTPVTYTYKNTAALTLEAGKKTVFNITVKKTALALTGITVADWGESTATTTVRIQGVTGAGTLSVGNEENFTPAEGDKLTLSYDEENYSTYTYGTTGWTSDNALIWENFVKGADDTDYKFLALYTFAATPVLEADYLYGTATVKYGADIPLTLNHAMAKMTLTLVAGDGVTADELTALTKQVTLTKTDNCTPNINEDGTTTIPMKTAAEAVTFPSGESFFVAPQTLTDANTIVLTRSNGNTYTIKLTDLTDGAETPAAIFTDNKIEAGKHYQIEITVSETKVGINATIADWTTVNGSGTMTPDWAE